ncbi:MAG: adaptor protein MecA [Alistipes sp.]|nr:adaptor protein MecA [Alistipes sp.]
MRIERVDEKTIKCFLSNEELEQYEIDYKDFVMRSDKAREVVQEIISQAKEEVGYEPPKYAFDLQIMMVPGQGMVLTFQEKDLEDLQNNGFLMECLKEMQNLFKQGKIPGGELHFPENLMEMIGKMSGGQLPGGQGHAPAQGLGHSGKAAGSAKGSGAKGQEAPPQPDFAVFAFRNIGRVMEYASVLPKNLRVKSALYAMDGLYYIHMQKGGASYQRYSSACVQALEFAGLFAASEDRLDYLREHGECLIEEQALKKLRTN